MSGWIYENNFQKGTTQNYQKNYKHPSISSPKFKGLNTFDRMLKNNEKAGCTVHFVNEKLDGSNMITKNLFISKKDDKLDLKKKHKNSNEAFQKQLLKF